MTFTIYQLPAEHNNCFMNYEWAEKHGGINVREYESIYTGEMEGTDPIAILEALYVTYNRYRPEGYTGRSLSVSDLVALEDTGTYFCDSIGWKKIN